MQHRALPRRAFRHRCGRAARGALLGLVSCGALSGSTPAADPSDFDPSGQPWYYAAAHLEQAHALSTGAGVTVAVIDSGFNTELPDLAGANIDVREPAYCADADGRLAAAATSHPDAEHGSTMVSIVAGAGAGTADAPAVRGVAPGAHVLAYRFASGDTTHSDVSCVRTVTREGHGPIRAAVDDGADIISASWSSTYPGIWDEIVYAERAGVIVVAAAPNADASGAFGTDLPLQANGVVGVAAAGRGGSPAPFAAAGPDVSVLAPGVDMRAPSAAQGWAGFTTTDGSSAATAYTAGALALVWSAYPDATANQVIQTLVRTAVQPPAGAAGFGYGAVDISAMLAADPLAFPDVNPVLSDAPDQYPQPQDVLGR